jgi:uncharacterized protein YeeX (DUF496 family)
MKKENWSWEKKLREIKKKTIILENHKGKPIKKSLVVYDISFIKDNNEKDFYDKLDSL